MKNLICYLVIVLISSQLFASNVIWKNQGCVHGMNSIAKSSDGKFLAFSKYGTDGYKFQIWDLENKEKFYQIDSISPYIFEFSSNSKYLGYINYKRLYILDLTSKTIISDDSIPSSVYKIKCVPDSNQFIFFASDDDGSTLYYKKYDFINKLYLDEFSFPKDYSDYVNYSDEFEISSDNKYFITSFFSKYSHRDTIPYNDVIIYDLETKDIIRKPMQNEKISKMIITSDNKYFVSFGQNYRNNIYTIYYVELATGDTVKTFSGQVYFDGADKYPNIIKLDDNNILTIYYSGVEFSKFDLNTGSEEKICNFKGKFSNLWINNDNTVIAAEGDNIYFWNFPESPGSELIPIDTLKDYVGDVHTNTLSAVDISADRNYVATAGRDKVIKVWDCTDGSLLYDLCSQTESEIRCLKISNSGNKIAWGTYSTENMVVISDFKKDNQFIEIKDLNSTILDIDWSPDDKTIAVSSYDDFVRVYNSENGELLFSFDAGDWVNAVEYSPNGRLIAACNQNRALTIFDTELQNIIFYDLIMPKYYDTGVEDVNFTKDGKYLVTSCGDGYARLFETTQWTLVREYNSKTDFGTIDIIMGSVSKSKISNDKKNIYGLVGGIIKVWDYNTSATLYAYDDFYPYSYGSIPGEITNVALSNDNTFFVTVSNNGDVIKWKTYNITDVNEIEPDDDLTIYPNPANDFIIIKNILEQDNTNSNNLLTIINPLGEIVLTTELQKDAYTKIDISSHSAGLYIIELNRKIYKFIKL